MVRLARLEIASGTDPVSELRERSRTNSPSNRPNEVGIAPVSEFSDKYNELRVLMLPIKDGTGPVIEQDRRSSTWSAPRRVPNQSGIEPGSANPDELNKVKSVKFARESTANLGFERPTRVRLNPDTVIPTTRPFRHLTPVQEEQGSAFLGQSLALIAKDDRRSNNADRSIREDSSTC